MDRIAYGVGLPLMVDVFHAAAAARAVGACRMRGRGLRVEGAVRMLLRCRGNLSLRSDAPICAHSALPENTEQRCIIHVTCSGGSEREHQA